MLTKRNVTIATALAAAVLAAVNIDVRAGDRKKKAAAAQNGFELKSFPFPEVEHDPIPTWKGWSVRVSPTVKGEERDAHLALAEVLSGMDFVPKDRAGHFKSYDTPEFRLDGWDGSIESASPTLDGVLVVLRVRPLMASVHGASTTILDSVLERYEVSNGAVRYLDSAEEGLGGGYVTD